MRTTLDLTDEAYSLAKAVARERNLGLGRAISEIILNYANPADDGSRTVRVEMENGLPVVRVGRLITSEEVAKILDETE